jgi:hypothetical protein
MRRFSLTLVTAAALALGAAGCSRAGERQEQRDDSMHPTSPGAGPKPGQPDPTGATLPRAGMGYDPSRGSAMNPGANPSSQQAPTAPGAASGGAAPSPVERNPSDPGTRGSTTPGH